MYNDLDIELGIDHFGKNIDIYNVGRVESIVVKKAFWRKLLEGGYHPAPRKPAISGWFASYKRTPSCSVEVPGSRDCGHEYDRYFPVDSGVTFNQIDAEIDKFLQPNKITHPFL